jgi:hypothetical protein
VVLSFPILAPRLPMLTPDRSGRVSAFVGAEATGPIGANDENDPPRAAGKRALPERKAEER